MIRTFKMRWPAYLALGIWLLASPAFAFPPEEVHQQLNLTPEQEKKLEEHRRTHREQAKALHEEQKQKREALRQELEKPELDMAKVKALHDEMKGVHDKLADHRLDGILEVRQVLTPEQFKKFQELTRDHWEKKGKRLPKRGEPRPHHGE
ncbi:MAG: Spy/CpxP family protein refolding chaperone [Elusimicrobia bacterium]|nr:Spy/CpxP family protein refolding chaperone [Elusimicrobiota bacterium]